MSGGVKDTAFWAARERCPVAEGELRLLSAWEVLEAYRESGELAGDGLERALCSNACLIARALEHNGEPVYAHGRAVLDALRVEEIARLANQWGEFNRAVNPSPLDGEKEIQARKKAWSTRRMRAFSGVCSGRSARFPQKNGQRT